MKNSGTDTISRPLTTGRPHALIAEPPEAGSSAQATPTRTSPTDTTSATPAPPDSAASSSSEKSMLRSMPNPPHKPRVVCFGTVHWDNEDQYQAVEPELCEWLARVDEFLAPDELFLAAGTRTNPTTVSPRGLAKDGIIRVAQSGLPRSRNYDPRNWNYASCAYMAGCWYALLSTACLWDVLVILPPDVILGVDLRPIIREFMTRDEIYCGPEWLGKIGDSPMIFKREAVLDYVHQRRRGDLVAKGRPMLVEEELFAILGHSWWNPWPHTNTCRMEAGAKEQVTCSLDEILTWPSLTKADPETEAAYRAAHPCSAEVS